MAEYLSGNNTSSISSTHLSSWAYSYKATHIIFILNLYKKMTTLKSNVTFSCNDEGFSPEEKLTVLNNEAQCSQYTEEEYDEAVYGKQISKYDLWMWAETVEERNNTSLDPLFLEDWIDVELLSRVKQLHEWIKVPTQQELENFDKLNDVMTIDNNPRDRKKFFVMNKPGYRTEYHMLPGWWMVSTLVKSSSPYTRKVIWNEEWNFEEIESDDKPDWLIELEDFQEEKEKEKKLEHKTKILWKAIKDTRNEYKPLYNIVDRLKWYDIVKDRVNKIKKKADKSYAEYKYYSRAMDKVKELDAKAEIKKLEAERDMLLHLFVELQQKCPDELVDSVLREDIKAKYKKEWYERTRYYLVRLIRRAEVLNQQKKYEEEEATA